MPSPDQIPDIDRSSLELILLARHLSFEMLVDLGHGHTGCLRCGAVSQSDLCDASQHRRGRLVALVLLAIEAFLTAQRS